MISFYNQYKSHYKSLIYLGIPIVIGQIGQIIMSFTDTLMIGHHSTDELGAASFVNNMFTLVIIFSTGFSYGLTPIVGTFFGQNQSPAIGRTLKNSLFANFLIGILLTAIMSLLYFNIENLNQPPELIPLMKPYFIVLLLSLIPVLLFNAFKQFADGITDTKTSMWILIGGNLLNIAGNYVLIYGKLGFKEMGLLGAGVSTLFSRILMLIVFITIFFFTKQYLVYMKGFKQSKLNMPDFRKLNNMGWPIALQMGMETASFSLSAIMIGWLGTIALASHQIMLSISQIGFMMYYGMGAAVAIRISYFKGKEDILNIRHSANAGFHIIMVMAMFVSIPIFLLRNYIGSWFTDNEAVNITVAGLIIPFIFYQFGDGLQITFANALRGISDVKSMMIIAFIAYIIISLPLGYFLGFVLNLGTVGVWFAFPFGLTSAGIMLYFRFRKNIINK